MAQFIVPTTAFSNSAGKHVPKPLCFDVATEQERDDINCRHYT